MSGLVRASDDADLEHQPPSVGCPGDDRPRYIVWPATDSNLLTAQRSFVQDMASQSAVFRPEW